MTPFNFPESNKTLGAPPGITNCDPLQVYADGETCLSCWRPTWRELVSILFLGRVWMWVWSGTTQPPVALEGKRTVFENRIAAGITTVEQ